MPGTAAKIVLTDTMYEILQRIANSRTVGLSIVTRAKVILLGFSKQSNQEIAKQLDIERETVGRWRKRWRDSFPAMLAVQLSESAAKFQRCIEAVLSDAPRSGSPGAFTPEQIVGIIAVACEPPSQSGLPVTTWTGRELAAECEKRGIVESISASHANYLLRQVDLQPHRSCYWCNTTEKDREKFASEVQVVCQTYLEAPDLYHQFNTHTVCVDEMTGVQANERRAETKPPKPGQIAKEEFNYTRHGALCVIGNWNVVLGQMIKTTITEKRDNEDFARHIERMVATDAEAGWVIVVDNLNIHYGEPLVRSVAKMLGIDPSVLGASQKARCIEVDGDSSCILERYFSSDSLCVHAEAQLMAQPNPDHLWCDLATSASEWQLFIEVGLERQTGKIHCLFQQSLCKADELDLHWASDPEYPAKPPTNLA